MGGHPARLKEEGLLESKQAKEDRCDQAQKERLQQSQGGEGIKWYSLLSSLY